MDVAEIIRPLADERGWPAECLRQVGFPQCWQVCPDLLQLVFDNLLRNTEEAYSRRKTTKPEMPGVLTLTIRPRR